jgi:hypothetical protein
VEIKKIEVKKKHIKDVETPGNCGYIIKDGVPFPVSVANAKVKIEVNEANEVNVVNVASPALKE